MRERLNEIHIGDKDPYTWIMYEGKETLMGVLYSTILSVIEKNSMRRLLPEYSIIGVVVKNLWILLSIEMESKIQ